jgi:hypothetical protein
VCHHLEKEVRFGGDFFLGGGEINILEGHRGARVASREIKNT